MLKITAQNLIYKYSAYKYSAQNISISRNDFTDIEMKIINFVRDVALNNNLTARIVGGWVRDKLLGLNPKDIDLTIEGATGLQFGILIQKQADISGIRDQVTETNMTSEREDQIKNLQVGFLRIFGEDIEIVGLRKEIYKPGNRVPIIEEGNPEEDAYRRDLTINSIFYNINTGKIEDYTGQGYDDLSTMTIRTPLNPKMTFLQDPVRVLRVLRFYSRYNKAKLAPELLEVMNSPKEMREIHAQIYRKLRDPESGPGITPERFAMEFKNIMQTKRPEVSIKFLYQTGLLNDILNLPESFNPLNMDQHNRNHKLNVIDHTIEVIKNTNNLAQEYEQKYGIDKEVRGLLNLSALFHDLGKLDPRSHIQRTNGDVGYTGNPNNPEALVHEKSSEEQWNRFSKALKLSNDEQEVVGSLVLGHMVPHSHIGHGTGNPIGNSALRRFKRKNPYWNLQYILSMADAMSKNTLSDESVSGPYREYLNRIENLEAPPVRGKNTDLLNGPEIMSIIPELNPKPPPGQTGFIEVVKEDIRELQDEKPDLSKEEAIMFIKNNKDKYLY